jgi:hypothetical protein
MSTKNGEYDVANIEHVPSVSETHFDPTLEKLNVKQGDDALQFTIENGSIHWTKEEERAILWKIDLRLVPLVGKLSDFSTTLTAEDAGCFIATVQRHTSVWNCSYLQNDPGPESVQNYLYGQCSGGLHLGS